jgi:hypothetical protein
MRVIEKHLRDEVINRCIEFLDITIHFLLYIEQIYSNGLIKKNPMNHYYFFSIDIFEKRLKYNQIVYECQDIEVQNYISDFLNQIKFLLRKQLIDQIGFVITKSDEHDILRRYLIELHPIINHSLNTVHSNGNIFLAELDSIFSICLIELMRQIPVIENENEEEIHWKLQMRLCHHENNKFEFEEIFYEQFRLIDNIQMSLKQIKSVHSQRLQIQLMCQNKE